MAMRTLSLVLLALFAVANSPAVSKADDETRPFKGTIGFEVTGASPLPNGYLYVTGVLSGKLTVLGKFQGTVDYVIAPDGSFIGNAVKIDSRGNKLYEYVVGQFTATGSFGTVKVTGGTGKYREATGHSTFLSTWIVPGSTSSIVIDGVISLDD